MKTFTILSLAALASAIEHPQELEKRASLLCGIPGSKSEWPINVFSWYATKSATDCQAYCKRTRNCQSFMLGKNYCWAYRSAAATNWAYDKTSNNLFWDLACTVTASSASPSGSSSTTTSSTTTTPAAADPNDPVLASAAPVSGDSPPLTDTANIAFPTEDPNFTLTYTYDAFALPTVSVMGTAPNTAGLGPPTPVATPSCMLDASDKTQQFNILGSNYVPLVSSAGNVAPLASPTSEAQAIAMGSPDSYPLPSFYFEKPANAPAGIYDLVLAVTPPRYVAKTAQGGVVLTDSSTGAKQVSRRGQNMQTSVFQLDCKGRITASQNGRAFYWDVSEDSVRFTAGTSNKTMVTYPVSRAKATRLRRRSKHNTGRVPRCVKEPETLVCAVRPGARNPFANGCGPSNGFDFVPDFSFGSCCNNHDYCYDDCKNGIKEGCDNDFHSCMRGQGCDYLNKWYTWLVYLACQKAADFYYWSVDNYAQSAFNDATKERCTCLCPGTQSLCGSSPNTQCRQLFNNDVQNCGACDRQCPDRTKCENGNCVCPQDKCGNTCLSLKNNPDNCGACNNKCSTGYCYNGACYTPPKACDARFTNGDFTASRNLNDWNFSPYSTSTVSGGRYNGRANYGLEVDSYNKGDIQSLYVILPHDQGQQVTEFTTDVIMCPGKQYRFDLAPFMDEGFNGNNPCTLSISFADQYVCQRESLGGWGGWGGPKRDYPLSLASDVFKRDLVVGPFTKQSSGVVQNSLELNVPFKVRLECNGAAGGPAWAKVRLANFKITPV